MAVICRGVVYICNMTEASPVLENVAGLSKLSITNNFFSSNLLGKLMIETFFQHKLFVKTVFKFLCYKQFFFKSIFRTLVAFFILLFGCPTTNFGPLFRGESHSPDVNHHVSAILTWMSREPWMKLCPWTRLSTFAIWTSNLPILIAMP